MYAVVAVIAIVFILGFYYIYRLANLGVKERRWDRKGERIKSLILYGILQKRVLREGFPGTFHSFIFWGLLFLLLVTFLVFVQMSFHLYILPGESCLYLSLLSDLVGLMVMVGVLLAAYRRYIKRPERLSRKKEDAVILSLVLLVVLTGFMTEGVRILNGQPGPLCRESPGSIWDASWSPVGATFGWFFAGIGLRGQLAWSVFWWLHLILALALILAVPFSKLCHLVIGPLNTFFRSLRPKGALRKMEISEDMESFGVQRIEQFTSKQLWDLFACMECGRCQDRCPAWLTGKPLSPKKVITDLTFQLYDRGPRLLRKLEGEEQPPPLGGGVIGFDEIWSCTTCGACQEHCPVFIEHIDKIVDMRRAMVMMESDFPNELTPVLRSLETQFNPYMVGNDARADWAKDLGIKVLSKERGVEYLYFVGCTASFDERNRKVAVALTRIMGEAGITFGILGTEERCCGEPLRRIGNEYLAQMMISENISTFKKYGVRKIVTACPHCYNTLKNEYPDFGGEFQVLHHTELLSELIEEGRIKPSKKMASIVTYHDSCYLGRHNDIYEQPRGIVENITIGRLKEMKNNRYSGFCCGAGGGRMWMEETLGSRINEKRIQEVLDAGADTLASACPFCLIMLGDGIKAKDLEEELQILDVAELLASSFE